MGPTNLTGGRLCDPAASFLRNFGRSHGFQNFQSLGTRNEPRKEKEETMKPADSMTMGKAIAVSIAVLGLAASTAGAEPGPFARMAGTWLGEGRVILSDGQVERIRCRASGDVGGEGDSMHQRLRCAGASYNFDIRNSVVARQGKVIGNWDETTRNVSGQVTGSVSGGVVRARVDGGQFKADVTLVTTKGSMRVTLIPYGTSVREVSIQLRRS
jgi:hypothetical protein